MHAPDEATRGTRWGSPLLYTSGYIHLPKSPCCRLYVRGYVGLASFGDSMALALGNMNASGTQVVHPASTCTRLRSRIILDGFSQHEGALDSRIVCQPRARSMTPREPLGCDGYIFISEA